MKQTILPTVAVIGGKKSGKTSLMKGLIHRLRNQGYNVMSAKHVNVKGFTFDTKGTDTWWYSKSGANPVVCVSDSETTVIHKTRQTKFSLEELKRHATEETDLLLLEGFSRWVMKDESVAKVITIRDISDLERYERTTDQVLFICSYLPKIKGKGILDARKDIDVIVDHILRFVKSEREVYSIYDKLPKLDCGKCGYGSCLEMARSIKKGKASIDECITLRSRSELRSKVVIRGGEIPLQPFASEILRRGALGMLSSLKGININGDEFVEIRVS